MNNLLHSFSYTIFVFIEISIHIDRPPLMASTKTCTFFVNISSSKALLTLLNNNNRCSLCPIVSFGYDEFVVVCRWTFVLAIHSATCSCRFQREQNVFALCKRLVRRYPQDHNCIFLAIAALTFKRMAFMLQYDSAIEDIIFYLSCTIWPDELMI